MSKFTMLVGIPASGKSSFAASEDAVWLSSDNLREELLGDRQDQTQHAFIFAEMLNRTRQYLKEGKEVIYDATNLSKKRRKNLLSQIKATEKECIVFVCELEEILQRDKQREFSVGEETILRMIKQFNCPSYDEGWDKISVLYTGTKEQKQLNLSNCATYESYCQLLVELGEEQVVEMDQQNSHHIYTLSRHQYKCYEALSGENELVCIAGLFHDIGKPECKIQKDGYCRYDYHANVSAYKSLSILRHFNLNNQEMLHVANLIQLHMLHYSDCDLKKKITNEHLYQDLMLLNQGDLQAHGL